MYLIRKTMLKEAYMSTESAHLKLATAVSLVAETSDATSDIQGIRGAWQSVDEIEGFWDSIQASSRIGGEIGALRAKLDQAISLANEAQ